MAITLLMYSCSNDKNHLDGSIKIVDSFPITKELKGEEILQEVIGVAAIHVAGNYLLIENLDMSASAYEVFALPSLNFVGHFGRQGDAPNEWRIPRFADQVINSENGVSVWINDVQHHRLQLLDLSKSIRDSSVSLTFSKSYHPSHDFTQEITVLNDSLWVALQGPSTPDLSRLVKYNSSKDQSVQITGSPVIFNSHKMKRQGLYELYFSYLRVKPDNSRVVSAMVRFNRIDIYDQDLSLETSIVQGDDYESFDINDLSKEGFRQTIYYQDLAVSDNYIYALYYNQTNDNYAEDLISTSIRVFNWKGDAIANFQIPDYLTTFSVDESNEFIYGASYFQEKKLRYKYTLEK